MHLARPALAAACLLGLPAGSVVAMPPRASGAQTICVGVVVDARSLGGGLDSGCATVADGATGTKVLIAAGHTLTFRRDGVLCMIDGLPKEGCGRTDSSHYWSYWHRAPGGSTWTYSTQGPGTYRPADRSTEGWVWQSGGSEGSSPPPDVGYDTACPPRTATPTATSSSPPAPAAAQVTATATSPPAPAQTPASATPSSAPPSAAPSPPSAPPSATPSLTTSRATASGAASSSGGFPVGLVVGLATVVLVGGGAAARNRRS